MLFINMLITFNVNYCIFKINCIYLPQNVAVELIEKDVTTSKCR